MKTILTLAVVAILLLCALQSNAGEEFAIVTNANELFCGIAMSIKKQSPFKYTMTVQQTNGAHGVEKLVHVSYQANVPLPACDLPLVAGLTGSGKIHAGYQSIAQRLWRLACHTFHFEL